MSAGVVAALAAEARTLGPRARRADGLSITADGTLLAVGGIGCTAAAAAARALSDAGAQALVSWGLAGGLDPALCAGTVCVPLRVISRDGRGFDTDQQWRELVLAALAPMRLVMSASLLTTPTPIDDIASKAAAFRDSGAAAVDMESVAIAEVAANRGLAFIAVRVIVDTAADTLPDAVLAASSAGHVRVGRLIRGLMCTPGDLVPLLRLVRRYRAATRALVSVARSGALTPPRCTAATASRIA